MNKKSNWSVAVYLLIVFASGALVGGFSHRLYSAKSVSAVERRLGPEDYRKKYVAEAQSRLNLTPEQVENLNVIMDLTRARFRELRERNEPEVKQIHREQVDKINAMLSPEQQREYAQMREEREQERKRRDSKSSGR